MITIEEFINLLNEVYVRVAADGVSTPQCVDIAQLWNRVIGGPRFTGNAVDLANQAGSHYTFIANSADNFPVKGNLVVWGSNYNGGPGHVGLATGQNTSSAQFEVLEQNDPTGSDAHIQRYNYTDVLGWLHPNNPPQTLTPMPTYLQGLFAQQGLNVENEGAVRTFWQQALDFPACNTDKLSAQTALGTANNKVAELQGSLTNAQAAITQQNGVIENTKLQLTASDNTITTLTNKINGMQPPQIKSPITLFFFKIFG